MSSNNDTVFSFYSDCVSWDEADVDNLSSMIDDSSTITRETFLKHVDKEEFREMERTFGYAVGREKGLKMADDWAVSYSKSKLHGQLVYFFTHSAIEFVFISPDHEMPDGDEDF